MSGEGKQHRMWLGLGIKKKNVILMLFPLSQSIALSTLNRDSNTPLPLVLGRILNEQHVQSDGYFKTIKA